MKRERSLRASRKESSHAMMQSKRGLCSSAAATESRKTTAAFKEEEANSAAEALSEGSEATIATVNINAPWV